MINIPSISLRRWIAAPLFIKINIKQPTMNLYYFIQPNNLIIIILFFLIINILNIKKIIIFIRIYHKYFLGINIICNLFYINFFSFFKKFWLYILISKKLKFVLMLQDKFLVLSWTFSKILKRFAFYNINLGFIFYFINTYLNLSILSYIYKINFLISIIIILSLIIKLCENKNLFMNKFLKFVLYLLLWLSIGMLLYLSIKIISHFFVFIITKIMNMKNLIKKGLSNNSPNNPDFDLNYHDSTNKRKKKRNKYIQQKAEEMRNKLLIQQKSKNKTSVYNNSSLSSKRGINKHIYIEPRQNFNTEAQFERIKSELKAYDIQQKKFKSWSKGKGKDFTYPDEARELFKEYSKILKDLRPYLKSMKKKVKKQLKK